MSASAPLLQTIEPDDISAHEHAPTGTITSNNVPKPPPPASRNVSSAMASTPSDAESGPHPLFYHQNTC